MAAAAEVDLSTMLYLNPELAAFSNVTSLSAVEEAWASGSNALSGLFHSRPVLPSGFDPKVYVAAQGNVSPLNSTIFMAMVGMGMSSNSIVRRGTYVSTLMAEVVLSYSSNSGSTLGMQLPPYDLNNEPFRFSACNLNAGDYVRLQRLTQGQGTCGDPLYGRVLSVTSASHFRFEPASPAAFHADLVGVTGYTLSGIRIWDVERQALVAFSRNAASFSNALSNAAGGGSPSDAASFPGYVNSNDVVPRTDFNLAAYRAIYPDVKLLDFSDAYLDYRMREKRADDYRIVNGKNIFNLEAPYASNLTYGGGSGYGPFGYNASFSNNLTVNGNLGIGMPCTGAEGSSAEIDAWDAAQDLSSSNAWWMGSGSNTRLAVAGDIFATGTLISLSDARVKSHIRPIENALERISHLTGYTYEVAGAPPRKQTGLLAQEVAGVLPEAVFYRSSEGVLDSQGEAIAGPIVSIAYGNLAGLIVNAIKELSDRLAALERKIAPS